MRKTRIAVAMAVAVAVGATVAPFAPRTLPSANGADVASPPPMSTDGVLVGASVFYDHTRPKMGTSPSAYCGNSSAEITCLEGNIGRRLDVDNNYYGFCDPGVSGLSGCPANSELVDSVPGAPAGSTLNDPLTSDDMFGRIPLESWGLHTDGSTCVDPQTIAADYTAARRGKSEPLISYIQEQAQDVATYAKPIYVRFAWEMAAGANASCVNGETGHFVDAWRDIYTIFHDAGATNAAFVWCPGHSTFDNGTAKSYYPGPGYVDYVCADGYNTAGYGSSEADFDSLFDTALSFTLQADKPFIVGETGTFPGSASSEPQATWLKHSLAAEITAWNSSHGHDIKALLYFDSYACKPHDNDYTITGSNAVDALSTIVKRDGFNPEHKALFDPATSAMEDTFASC